MPARMFRLLCSAVPLVSLWPMAAHGAEHQATATRPDDDYLVGVYYFAGWWPELPNKWITAGKDWRGDWPGRVPLLGAYNDQATMDREIVAAAEHGVDFFQILYYIPPAGKPPEPHAAKLNNGLTCFLASPEARRMKFTIEWVNHPPFDKVSDAQWREVCRTWAGAMKHRSYLTIAGRPVFKVHGYQQFMQAAGQDVSVARARLDVLRRAAHEAGAGEPIFSAGILPEQLIAEEGTRLFEFFTTYMWMPQLPKVDEPYAYARLIDYAEAGWRLQAEKGTLPYVPYMPAGWDPRPWKDPRPSFAMPTREEWTDALQRVKKTLDERPRLRVPVPRAGAEAGEAKRVKMLLIYAWNEFGEGGIVAPTQGDMMMKLECIREVFGGKH